MAVSRAAVEFRPDRIAGGRKRPCVPAVGESGDEEKAAVRLGVLFREGCRGGYGDLVAAGVSDSLRTFGAVVQALREHAGYCRVEFGEVVRFSKHTVESVELGRRMPDDSFVERAEEATGNTGALRNSARYLTRGEAGLAAWFRRWAKLEKVAVSLCTYECRLLPGLLQPEACARTLFENRIPLLTDEQSEAQVAARLERQRMLCERPTEVLRGQLDHVLERTALRSVTLQITPMDAEFHSCLDGPLRLLETPQGRRWRTRKG